VKPCDRNIFRTIQLSQEMIHLADQGDEEREDTGCGVLYGVLRDSAYKILKLAEEEKQRHQAKGWWSQDCQCPTVHENDGVCSPLRKPNVKKEE
jgi:hypothetical protein